jgi:ribosomal protein S18 acetylase RimI-like enzyme
MTSAIPGRQFEIRPVAPGDLDAVLEVYRQCQDFLALGPVPAASMDMVLKDIETSRGCGGLFCGIRTAGGAMAGIVDYVPGGFEGDPGTAHLSLLMISAPYRKQGIGRAVVGAVEAEIGCDPRVRQILTDVQANNPDALRFWQGLGYRIVHGPALMPDRTTVYGLRKDIGRPAPGS